MKFWRWLRVWMEFRSAHFFMKHFQPTNIQQRNACIQMKKSTKRTENWWIAKKKLRKPSAQWKRHSGTQSLTAAHTFKRSFWKMVFTLEIQLSICIFPFLLLKETAFNIDVSCIFLVIRGSNVHKKDRTILNI